MKIMFENKVSSISLLSPELMPMEILEMLFSVTEI
jgi:hypothetical protein